MESADATSQLALLRMLWFASPALPIGAYAYSRGLEQAIDRGDVTDGPACTRWIEALLTRQIATLDAPFLLRLHAAFARRDDAEIDRLCVELRAFRESAELALEDEQLGLALSRLLRGLSLLDDVPVIATQSYVAMLAYAAVRYQITPGDMLRVLFFSCAESQITVASKSIPLGQTEAQRVLSGLIDKIPALVARAEALPDDALGAYAPGVAMASALHETQYSRLYRS